MAKVVDSSSHRAPADESLALGEIALHVDLESARVVDIDVSGLDLLGYSASDMIGTSILRFVHADDRDGVIAAANNTRTAGAARCIARIRHADGSYVRYTCITVMSSDGKTLWIRTLNLDRVARTGEEYWQYARLSDLSSDHFVVTDRAGSVVHMNRAACELYGLSEEEARGQLHKGLAATPEGVANIESNCRLHLTTGEPVRFRVPVMTPENGAAILECVTLWDDISQRWFTVERNISAQVEQERQLSIAQRFFDSGRNQLALLDNGGHLRLVNPSFEELVGSTNDALIGRRLSDVFGIAPHPDRLQLSIDWVVAEQCERRIVVPAATDHGERMLSVFLRPDPDGGQVFFSGTDITEELRLADDLKDRATHDQLTRLPTRDVFNESLQNMLVSGYSTAIMMLDVDDFKHVNDSLGHDAGDQLLIIIGSRLRAALRADDVVARFGGDEFVVLLRGSPGTEEALNTAEKVRQALAEPYRIANRDMHVTASIGLAIGSHMTHTASQLLSEADTAAYEAKHLGRNRVQLFGPELAERTARRVDVERHLRAALANEEIDCDVQKVFDVASGAVAGVEVFVRMCHPVKGRVGPSEFYDVARQLGLLGVLGERVIDLALRSLSGWLAGNPGVWVSFNVDPDEVAGRTYCETLQRLAKRHRVRPSQIVIELREAGFGAETGRVSRALDQLVAAGFRICVDDFGAGSTSLGHLRSSRVQRVKIDESYVEAMTTDATVRTIVQTIFDLGGTLGVEVAAEGVRTEQQVSLLKELGCDLTQGYLLHRPIPIEFFTA